MTILLQISQCERVGKPRWSNFQEEPHWRPPPPATVRFQGPRAGPGLGGHILCAAGLCLSLPGGPVWRPFLAGGRQPQGRELLPAPLALEPVNARSPDEAQRRVLRPFEPQAEPPGPCPRTPKGHWHPGPPAEGKPVPPHWAPGRKRAPRAAVGTFRMDLPRRQREECGGVPWSRGAHDALSVCEGKRPEPRPSACGGTELFRARGAQTP